MMSDRSRWFWSGVAALFTALIARVAGQQDLTTLIAGGLVVFLTLAVVSSYFDRRGRGTREQKLQPRYGQAPPYRFTVSNSNVVEHRIGIRNPGSHPAKRVRMELIELEPFPRHDGRHPPVVPYAVPMLQGGDEHIGISILPGREELWRVGYSGTGSDGVMSAAGFAVYDQRWRGLVWQFDPDERWRFTYRIAFDGGPDVEFSLVVTADNGHIRCDLEG